MSKFNPQDYPDYRDMDNINIGDVVRVPEIQVNMPDDHKARIEILAEYTGFLQKNQHTGELYLQMRVVHIFDDEALPTEFVFQIIGSQIWVLKERAYEDQIKDLVHMINSVKNPNPVMN